MDKHETAVYTYYRRNLARLNGERVRGNRDSRAADRRQRARAVTVDHFNLAYAEVKRIVSLGDVANGITHEHPVERNPFPEWRRVDFRQLQVGDRFVNALGTDARVTDIDGLNITARGIQCGRKPVQEWTYKFQADDELFFYVIMEDGKRSQKFAERAQA